MFETRITKLLGIKYPIVQGGIMWLSRAELTAAVSNAGGLGILASASFPTTQELRAELRKTKGLTDKPFGVNINLGPMRKPLPTKEFIDIILNEGVRIFETSGRSPEPFMKQLKKGGAIVVHKAPGGVRFAQTAEQIGCDAVSIIGFECGGHPGRDDTTTLVLIRAAMESIKIPVLAGGGIADAAGFVAALALGADGVVMGTRFMATKECPIHPKYQQWLLKAKENETVITQRSIGAPARNLVNGLTAKVLDMEKNGASLEQLMPFISGDNTRRLEMEGDLENGLADCGQVVGLVHDIPTVKEVMDRIVSGAEEIIKKQLYPLVK